MIQDNSWKDLVAKFCIGIIKPIDIWEYARSIDSLSAHAVPAEI